jgi:hypothetical protein
VQVVKGSFLEGCSFPIQGSKKKKTPKAIKKKSLPETHKNTLPLSIQTKTH